MKMRKIFIIPLMILKVSIYEIFFLFDDEIDEEIKQLEIDEQNILNLINKINNFGNDKQNFF